MLLIEQIKADLLQSRKDKNELIKCLLQSVCGELDKISKTPTDDDCIKTIKKMIDNSVILNTEDSKKEGEFLKKYLPKQMEKSEIESAINEIILQLNTKDFGKLMKEFQTKYKGLADNKIASEIIRNKIK